MSNLTASLLSLPIPPLEMCVLELFRIGAVKFGNFILKNEVRSPIYFDLRVIVSYPYILEMVSDLIWRTTAGEKFDHICGVPYTALPIASVISVKQRVSMLVRRKEAKSYGTKKIIEGVFTEGQTCLIIDDVILSGTTIFETIQILQNAKLKVKKIIIFLDREQGGRTNLQTQQISFTPVITIRQVLAILQKYGNIDDVTLKNVLNYLDSNQWVPAYTPSSTPLIVESCGFQRLSLKERASKASNPVARRLLTLMETKRSNLCVAVDVQTSEELLSFADKLGPFVCLLKTHVDILKDFSQDTANSLKDLAAKHNFLIFEDRIFADIGNTVQLQYSGGIHRILDWAHLVTVHGMPGPGTIQGMMSICSMEDRGCILVAEMSSDQNLSNRDYVKGCLKLAQCWRQFVVGFISQSPFTRDQDFILFTPGVGEDFAEGTLGQWYVCPEEAVLEKGADVIIVGRAVTENEDPVAKATEYQKKGYEALIEKLEEDDEEEDEDDDDDDDY